jgi:hypothetical protein
MPTDRPPNSRLSGSSSSRDAPIGSASTINPWISAEEYEGARSPPKKDTSGSKLQSERLDNMVEDTFPASDPPSTSPVTGMGSSHGSTAPPNLKESGAAQFEYGRRTEELTHRFDPSSRRLETGNPDVGEVDLGTIEADRPAQPDDHDHYDTIDEPTPGEKKPRLRDDVVRVREEF